MRGCLSLIHIFNRMVSDPNFTVDELAAISAGYARLLEEGGALVAELKTCLLYTSMPHAAIAEKEHTTRVFKGLLCT